jgi:hypothetical protein
VQNWTTMGRPAPSTQAGHGSADAAFFHGPCLRITSVQAGVIAATATFAGVVKSSTTLGSARFAPRSRAAGAGGGAGSEGAAAGAGGRLRGSGMAGSVRFARNVVGRRDPEERQPEKRPERAVGTQPAPKAMPHASMIVRSQRACHAASRRLAAARSRSSLPAWNQE